MKARAAFALALVVSSGCASTPYEFVQRPENELTLRLGEDEPQIERGRPNAWIDGFGHYFFSLPSKLLLLNWKVGNHDIPPDVELALQRYLHANGLCNTKVRLNQYAPGAEWRRLGRNREMPAFWRFTLGALSVAFYTIFPERLLAGFPIIGGGDHFNPYTNTISIYSGSRAIVLHEGGHSKDFSSFDDRHAKGLYAALRAVPYLGVPFVLWQEGVASSDALSWELAVASSRESKSAYRTLYPAWGTYLGGTTELFVPLLPEWWVLYAVQYGVVVGGHVVGQTRALFVREREAGIEPSVLDGPPAEDQATVRCSVPAPEPVPEPASEPEASPAPETPPSDGS